MMSNNQSPILAFDHRRGTRPLVQWFPWVLAVLFLAAVPAQTMAETPPVSSPEFRQPEDADSPERLVTIAIYLLVIVIVLSVSLLIVMMLWGVRVRREVRKPLPALRPSDPLWYLKTKKHPPAEPQGSDPVSERKTPPGNDSEGSAAN